MAGLKIARIVTRLNIGGPAQQVTGLTRTLTPWGWHTVLVTGCPEPREGEMLEEFNTLPMTYHRVPSLRRSLHPIRDLVAWFSILKILLKERPALLHTHMAKAGLLGRAAGTCYRWLTGSPLKMVHTFHGHVLAGYFGRFTNQTFCLLERWLAGITDCLIAISPSVEEDLIRLRVAPREKVRVICLGLPLDALLALPAPHPAPPFKVGLIGRMVPIKNHALLIEAARRLQTQVGEDLIRFELYGDGELRPRLEESVRRLGLERIVSFHGWARNMPEVYAGLNAVVLTSNNEGTPVSIIEALAALRPVVATDVGGVRDLVGRTVKQEGKMALCERGILVPPEDPETLAGALRHIATTAQVVSSTLEAGRCFVQKRLSLERLTRDLDALYRELLKVPGRRIDLVGVGS